MKHDLGKQAVMPSTHCRERNSLMERLWRHFESGATSAEIAMVKRAGSLGYSLHIAIEEVMEEVEFATSASPLESANSAAGMSRVRNTRTI